MWGVINKQQHSVNEQPFYADGIFRMHTNKKTDWIILKKSTVLFVDFLTLLVYLKTASIERHTKRKSFADIYQG